jgi:methionine-rich copper-binding protein CopC
MKRLIAFALALTLAVFAHAHTPLKASVPAADASVAAPKALELTFSGDVRLTSVALTDSGGAAKHLDAVPTAVASTFSLGIHEPLSPGAYKVVWRAVGGDTHNISGEFGITVR